MGADGWVGGVGVDCDITLEGSEVGSLAVGKGIEVCEGADGVMELATGVADPDVDLPRRKMFLREFFIVQLLALSST